MARTRKEENLCAQLLEQWRTKMVLVRRCTCIGRVREAGMIASRRMAHGHRRCVCSRLGAKKAEEQRLTQTARVANMETVLSLQPCLYPYTTPLAELPLERKEPRPCTVAVRQSGLEVLKRTLRSAFAAPQLCDLGRSHSLSVPLSSAIKCGHRSQRG